MKALSKVMVAGLAVFALLQVVRPNIPSQPATDELQAPPEVKQILERTCYSCHSDQRRLSWFDQIVPGYWLVRHDILLAREHLNFSTIGSRPASVQKATLYEAVTMIQLSAMPLPQFVRLHPEAKVTPDELATLKAYLAPWTNPPAAGVESGTGVVAPVSLETVRPEFNGLRFDPNFASWKPISTTDRGDNSTFRFILGNDVAVKAAQTGNISPWPDGARFAKIAWQQELGADALVHPGKFVQVELMVKNGSQYKDTEGWGWGRWRGAELTPYGKDARFVKECTGCHRPLRGNDYVYTTPITTAKVRGDEVVNNTAAALPASLPYQPLAWSAITMYVDAKAHTMATLYGNDAAIDAVRAKRAPSVPEYPEGAVLALVTWTQREDPHWFGARMPDQPQSVEFVRVGGGQGGYQRFTGAGLLVDQGPVSVAEQRRNFVLSLPPVWLP
jgi:Haem-binding domain/Cytochrome P460